MVSAHCQCFFLPFYQSFLPWNQGKRQPEKCIKHSQNIDAAVIEITMLWSKECQSHFILCECCPWNSPFCSTCAQQKTLLCFLASVSTENIQLKVTIREKLYMRIISVRIHQGSENVGSSDFFFFPLTTVTAKVEFHFYALRKIFRFYSYRGCLMVLQVDCQDAHDLCTVGKAFQI